MSNDIIKPIIAVLSPRDITVVKEGHDTFKDIPHLWLKYWHAIQAYHILTDFFLNKHKEFTHLVISPDDLVVKREHYEALLKTLEQEDYPVFSGVCNIDVAHPNTLNICIDEVPNIIRKLRRHKWADANKLPKEPIIKVKFSGMPFLFIRRDIVERIPLQGDTPYDPSRKNIEPKSFDAAFCYHCNELDIPIYVDTRVRMLHLRGMELGNITGRQADNLKVRKLRPRVYYQVNDEVEELTEHYLDFIYKLNPYNLNVYLQRYIKSSKYT